MKIFVNNCRNAGYLQNISFKTLQYWADAYSSRSMELVMVFVEKTLQRSQKKSEEQLFSVKPLMMFAIY